MFLPAERAEPETVSLDAQLLMRSALLEHITRTIPCVLMILNRERQVVYKNQRMQDLLASAPDKETIGKRMGEIIRCIHACESNGGCGTSECCRDCGAARAISQSQTRGTTIVNECSIAAISGESYEFRVWASPFRHENRDFTIVSLVDIRDEKRRQVLEKTFFHDVNNTLFVIDGYSEILARGTDPEKSSDFVREISLASKRLIDEIASHRRLLQAEKRELALNLSIVNSTSLLDETLRLFAGTDLCANRTLVIGEGSDDTDFFTDRDLLRRVLQNMVKNALEATAQGQQVRLAFKKTETGLIFSVHNPGCMPPSVRTQIFQRSFSTKGKGRGIGTYSMKLFGENYLKGKLWFTSTQDSGTTFNISLPLTHPSLASA